MASMTAQDSLFETEPAPIPPRSSPSPGEGGVDKTFRVYDQDQSFLMPPSLREWLLDDHLALFVSELVEEVLDLTPFLASYTEARGFPPYHPRLMLKVLLYGYTTGVRSSRKFETRCHDDVAFRYLAANGAPDFRSIARFRRRHLAALEALFLQVLALCQQVGMVRMGRVALDGTKVKANASRHKAMSYDRMCAAQETLEAEVKAMMGEAERVDAEEDAMHGRDNRGGDLQGEMARRESRLAKIRRAKDDLEANARAHAADTARTKAQAAGLDEEEAERDAARAAESATVKPKAQRNFTDSDARIMKTADGSFHYCYNAQAVVDDAYQVIVATDFAASGADNPAFGAMLGQTMTNTGTTPRETLADAGYFSSDNIDAADRAGTDPLIATGRLAHGDQVPDAPRGPIPQGRHAEAADGPQAAHQEGQGRLRAAQSDRRAGLRADENHAGRGPVAAAWS